MFKKIGIAAVVVGAGLFALNATGLSSYTATAVSKIRTSFKKQVPIEFEIDRLRHEVAQLVPEMKKTFRNVAEEMVAVENLQKEITVAKTNLQQQKDKILTMTKDLKSGAETFQYAGISYSRTRVKNKLESDFGSYKIAEAELKTKEQVLEAKEKSLDATRERLASIKAQKQELELEIAQLDAELKTIRLAQTRNKIHVDDSRLARCKQVLTEIRTRLNVEKREAELEGQFANDTIKVEQKAQPTGELIKDIQAHFNEKSNTEDSKDVLGVK